MAKKVTTKTNSVKAPKKKTSSKSKNSVKKTQSSRKAVTSPTSKKKVADDIIEYYDLPNKYNITMVKVLFQTPKKLFVYWEISENDKIKYIEEFGKDFFETTSPFLIVKNKTKNYSFEIEINDFANSWYFDVPDSNCDYEVELIRKNKDTKIPFQITVSNNMEVPNNHILFEQNRKEIFFKNVKNNTVFSKSTVNLQFINHAGNVRKANSFYTKFYDEKDLRKINNPSSN